MGANLNHSNLGQNKKLLGPQKGGGFEKVDKVGGQSKEVGP